MEEEKVTLDSLPCLGVVVDNLDARSLGRMRMCNQHCLEVIAMQEAQIAIERGMRRSVVAENSSLLLTELLRMEAAIVWESFETCEWEKRWENESLILSQAKATASEEPEEDEETKYNNSAPLDGLMSTPNLDSSLIKDIQKLRRGTKFCTVKSSQDGAINVAGGDEVNFSGIRLRLDQPHRPRKVSFRYQLLKGSSRRGFCNIFFSRHYQPYLPCRLFTSASPDVFSFLIPLCRQGCTQLWLPGMNHNDGVLGPTVDDDKWHSVEIRFGWGQSELLYHIMIDDEEITEGIWGTKLPVSFDAIRHIYIFNWLSQHAASSIYMTQPLSDDENSYHMSDNDENPECKISDLIIEEHIPLNTLSALDHFINGTFCLIFSSENELLYHLKRTYNFSPGDSDPRERFPYFHSNVIDLINDLINFDSNLIDRITDLDEEVGTDADSP
uniref:Uncharacterized protein n=1 Tax=Aureoumbra lagunensis TaxID=44058 RepID=A0A7S3NJV5_9STRA|mmetsp:Transcript_19242/g.24975  ORF Transcript_19242/g.24975 Transcript_19242/m.24975 type:complete len:441 (+) Transcript_19242:33-1355(+)